MANPRSTLLIFILLIALFSLGLPVLGTSGIALAGDEVMIIELEGPINPGTALYVIRGLEKAKDQGVAPGYHPSRHPGWFSLFNALDYQGNIKFPGSRGSLRRPKRAGAASAGVMITVAGHIAAMAKGTNIGAAHPVTAGGKDIPTTMSEKVVNDMAAYARGIAEDKGRNGEWVEKGNPGECFNNR